MSFTMSSNILSDDRLNTFPLRSGRVLSLITSIVHLMEVLASVKGMEKK